MKFSQHGITQPAFLLDRDKREPSDEGSREEPHALGLGMPFIVRSDTFHSATGRIFLNTNPDRSTFQVSQASVRHDLQGKSVILPALDRHQARPQRISYQSYRFTRRASSAASTSGHTRNPFHISA